jgi:hypothetical protein
MQTLMSNEKKERRREKINERRAFRQYKNEKFLTIDCTKRHCEAYIFIRPSRSTETSSRYGRLSIIRNRYAINRLFFFFLIQSDPIIGFGFPDNLFPFIL